MAPNKLSILSATPADVPLIVGLARELAEYEKLAHEMVATEALFHEHLFGPRPVAEALIAHVGGEGVGLALFFHNFSTFIGKPGIWLEDLYVRPSFRGRGIGKALLKQLARLAIDRKCGRLEWSVLDWNTPSIEFYKSLGAEPMEDWTTYRMTENAVSKLLAD